MSENNTITALLDSIAGASMADTHLFAADAVLDATVPHWRFTVTGGDAIRDEFAHWFAHPGRFETVSRTAIQGGEVVRFLLTWEEEGVPHAAHQAHIILVEERGIVSDTVFCGGRWPASLLAEMEAAHAHA